MFTVLPWIQPTGTIHRCPQCMNCFRHSNTLTNHNGINQQHITRNSVCFYIANEMMFLHVNHIPRAQILHLHIFVSNYVELTMNERTTCTHGNLQIRIKSNLSTLPSQCLGPRCIKFNTTLKASSFHLMKRPSAEPERSRRFLPRNSIMIYSLWPVRTHFSLTLEATFVVHICLEKEMRAHTISVIWIFINNLQMRYIFVGINWMSIMGDGDIV